MLPSECCNYIKPMQQTVAITECAISVSMKCNDTNLRSGLMQLLRDCSGKFNLWTPFLQQASSRSPIGDVNVNVVTPMCLIIVLHFTWYRQQYMLNRTKLSLSSHIKPHVRFVTMHFMLKFSQL